MGFLPKPRRHKSCHIAAVAVDVKLPDPILQCVYHSRHGVGVVVIEVRNVRPVVVWGEDVAVVVAVVAVGVGGNPRIVPGGVVRHPVEDDVHTELVDFLYQLSKILLGAEVGVHFLVILDAVRAAESAFTVFLADWEYRHQPQDVHAHIFEAFEVLAKSRKIALRCILADVHFVNIRRFGPFGCHNFFNS